MTQGLQVWDATGTMLLDTTERLTRVLGEVLISGDNSTISNPALATGIPWYIMRDLSAYEIYYTASCDVTISANSISWTYGTTGIKTNKLLIYGVY